MLHPGNRKWIDSITAEAKIRPRAWNSELSIPIEFYGDGKGASILAAEGAALAAALFLQADALQGHAPVHGLAHVVDSQAGHADSGERFHLHPGAGQNPHRGLDVQQVVFGKGKIKADRSQGQGMAQGDELAGALGSHDARQPCDFQDITLGQGPVADELGGGRLHAHTGAGTGFAQRLRLVAGVHHATAALVIEMSQFRHRYFYSRSTPKSTANWRWTWRWVSTCNRFICDKNL